MQIESPIRIAVCNDFELVIAGLAAMLEPHDDIEVTDAIKVGESVDGPVDVALYDTFGRNDEVPESIRALLDTEGVGRVAVYTGTPSTPVVDEALAAGAAGVLSKARPAKELVDGLRRIHSGEIVVDGTDSARKEPWRGATLGLTARQSEVVSLLLQGLSNADIAKGLNLDVNTVKTHLRHIYRALGVRSRSQVLAKLLRSDEFQT